MEIVSKQKMQDKKLEFPPGFRFHPTDEELIIQYLVKKIDDNSFCAIAIAEIDMNKCEPWDLPEMAKMGEREWYFFCVRDRKYPTGQRANRATNAGYWKATGKDREILKEDALIGMKKTLVFYKGRAPKGEKTHWVMHEYRLEGHTLAKQNLKPGVNEWVLSRVYEKDNHGKKMHGPKHGNVNTSREGPSNTNHILPPLMNSFPYNNETKITLESDFSQMINPFSNPNQIENPKTQHDNINGTNKTSVFNISSSSNSIDVYPSIVPNQTSNVGNSLYSNGFLPQEESFLKMQLENENLGTSKNQIMKQDFFKGTNYDGDISSVVYGNDMFQRWFGSQEFSPASTDPMVNDGFWNF